MFIPKITSFSLGIAAAADGEEAAGGSPAADAVRADRGELAGKSHPEGIPQGLLPGPAGHTLPGCWPGTWHIPAGNLREEYFLKNQP